MSNRRANLLKERVAIDEGLCQGDGCFFKRGPGNCIALFLTFLFQLLTRKRSHFNFGAALAVKSLADVIFILGNKEYLERLSADYAWLYLPNLFGGKVPGIRYSIASLIKHPHLWLGFDRESGDPLLLSERVLAGGASFNGSPGTGKSVSGLFPILHQTIAAHRGGVVVLDMKGSPSLFNMLKATAEANGHTFKWFTLRVGRSTFSYNPFLQGTHEFVSYQQQGEQMAHGLGLIKGEFYGADFFAGQCRRVLDDVLQRYGKARTPIEAYSRLHQILTDDWSTNADSKLKQDSSNLRGKVEVLSLIDPLNVVPGGPLPEVHQGAIQLKDVIKEKQVVYFDLSVAVGGQAARDIARGVTINVLGVSQELLAETGSPWPLYFAIDEMQEIVSQELAMVLEQGRESGIHALFAHHSLSQLKDGADDFSHIGRMPRLRRMFSVDLGSDDFRTVQAESGEKIVLLRQVGEFESKTDSYPSSSESYGTSETWSERPMPRLGPNEINEVNARQNLSIVRVGQGHGFSHFGGLAFVLYADRYLDTDPYTSIPWPAPTQGTMIVGREATLNDMPPLLSEGSDAQPSSKQEKHARRKASAKAKKMESKQLHFPVAAADLELQKKLKNFSARQHDKPPRVDPPGSNESGGPG